MVDDFGGGGTEEAVDGGVAVGADDDEGAVELGGALADGLPRDSNGSGDGADESFGELVCAGVQVGKSACGQQGGELTWGTSKGFWGELVGEPHGRKDVELGARSFGKQGSGGEDIVRSRRVIETYEDTLHCGVVTGSGRDEGRGNGWTPRLPW